MNAAPLQVHHAKLTFDGVSYHVYIARNPEGVEDICEIKAGDRFRRHLVKPIAQEIQLALNSRQYMDRFCARYIKPEVQRVYRVTGDRRVARAADFNDMIWQFAKAVDAQPAVQEKAPVRRTLSNGSILSVVP